MRIHTETHSIFDVETVAAKVLLAGGAITGAVILAPVVIPAFGVGIQIASTLAEECCNVVGVNTGAAGAISAFIEKVPYIGAYLTTEGGNNILAPAVTMLGGHSVGRLVSAIEERHGGDGSIGAFIRTSSVVLGVILALPMILPAVGHGVQFICRLAGMEEAGVMIAKAIGNTTACTAFASENGIKGGASVLLGHVPCLVPAFTVSLPAASLAGGRYAAQVTHERSNASGVAMGPV